MKNQPSFAFFTLGCKLNFAETSSIGKQLTELGFQKKNFEEPADVYVINTCSVTENADRECKKIVHKALQKNPDAFIAVIGCYAQLKPDQITSIEGVDLVLGATEKFNIAAYLNDLSKKQQAEVHSCEVDQADFFVSSYSSGDRTRSFLKVQDGCDYSCSYCTIPLARGASRSSTVSQVVKQAKEIASKGIKEIVLTGVNIGDFRELNDVGSSAAQAANFLDLIRALDAVDGIERFRISSIEPNLLTNEIIEFVSSSKKFVPHFHIPLQSGSNKILNLMRRRYLRELYAERVQKIKNLMPHCSIGVDVIVGFPGETEENFLETYQFLNDLNISYLHVFTYSERDNTEALKLTPVVPMAERKKRNKMLRILSEKKQRLFYESQLDESFPVLFESDNKHGMMHGFTPNYVKVNTLFDESSINQLFDVTLKSIEDDGSVSCEFTQSLIPV